MRENDNNSSNETQVEREVHCSYWPNIEDVGVGALQLGIVPPKGNNVSYRIESKCDKADCSLSVFTANARYS
jgi:hypothetical protein